MILAASTSMLPLRSPESPRTQDNVLSRSLADQTRSQSQKHWHRASLPPRLALQSSLKSASASASPLTGTNAGRWGGGEGCSDRSAREVFAPSLAGLIESTAIFQRLIKMEGSGVGGYYMGANWFWRHPVHPVWLADAIFTISCWLFLSLSLPAL